MYPPDRCHSFLDRDFLHISGTLITCLWTGWFAAIRRLFRLQQMSFPCLCVLIMNQRYIAFSFRTMTFVMFPIYFTFIFTFILPLDTLSTYINTAPALLYTLLLSSSQSWGVGVANSTLPWGSGGHEIRGYPRMPFVFLYAILFPTLHHAIRFRVFPYAVRFPDILYAPYSCFSVCDMF